MVDLIVNGKEIKDVSTIIFDKDGTLSDVHAYWSKIIIMRAWAIMEFYNLPREKVNELIALMGLVYKTHKLSPLGPIALVGRKELIWIIRKYLKELEVQATAIEVDGIFNMVNSQLRNEDTKHIVLIPGVFEFLSKLKALNVQMAVVTSDGIENAEHALDVMGIRDFFTLVMGHESCSASKDTGTPAVICMRDLNTDPEHTVVIGDAPIDAKMATMANIKASILVSTGQLAKKDIESFSEHIVDSMDRIKIRAHGGT